MKGVEQRAREYTAKIFNGATPSEVVKAYIAGATNETRELKRELEEERFVTADLKQQIERMKRCEICKHYRWNHCSYEINISEDCIQNKLKHFELKEVN